LKIEFKEHTVAKSTRFGTVQRSLNQHLVYIENDAKEMVHCGYIGDTAFLPLSGFPNELSKEVADAATAKFGRPIGTVEAPLSIAQINALAANQANEEDE
jgi:hypothetical protein